MDFQEKNYVVLITGGLLMLILTIIFQQDSLKINNLIIVLVGTYMGFRLKGRRKEYEKRMELKEKRNHYENDDKNKKKLNKLVKFFFKSDIMDERERVINLKSNNISLVFALLLSYVMFYVMNELNMFEQLKSTWFFYILSGYMFCKGFVGFIYSRIINVAY